MSLQFTATRVVVGYRKDASHQFLDYTKKALKFAKWMTQGKVQKTAKKSMNFCEENIFGQKKILEKFSCFKTFCLFCVCEALERRLAQRKRPQMYFWPLFFLNVKVKNFIKMRCWKYVQNLQKVKNNCCVCFAQFGTSRSFFTTPKSFACDFQVPGPLPYTEEKYLVGE